MKYNKKYDNYSDILINMPQFEKTETIRFNDIRNNTLNETVGVEKINLPVHVKHEQVEPVKVNDQHEQMGKLDLERENIINMINNNKVKEANIDSLIDNSEQTSNKTEEKFIRRRFKLFKNVR